MESATAGWAWPWWTALVTINAVNLVICLMIFRYSKNSAETEYASYRKVMRCLGLVFVSVALYRSVFVSSYLHQLAWFDSLANSSLLIRFLAIFAELSFAGLFMFSMLQVNRDIPDPRGDPQSALSTFFYTRAPYILFACIFIAQFFATTALVTKLEVLFAIEETLWGLGFLSILPLAISQWRRVGAMATGGDDFKLYRVFTAMNAAFCILYCSYSVFYHLPIELWPPVIQDIQSGNVVFHTGVAAISNAFQVVNQTRDFAEWGGIGFFIWHSGYFSLCVWMALFMMNGPRLLPREAGT
jgi:hypothetical protein